MTSDDPSAKDRLVEVLESLYCPVSGCWSEHGCRYEYREGEDEETYVLEVWPVAIPEPAASSTNGDHRSESGVLYEPATFDFVPLRELDLKSFHFSQQDSLFEIIWEEDGLVLGLRIHIVPVEVD